MTLHACLVDWCCLAGGHGGTRHVLRSAPQVGNARPESLVDGGEELENIPTPPPDLALKQAMQRLHVLEFSKKTPEPAQRPAHDEDLRPLLMRSKIQAGGKDARPHEGCSASDFPR